MSAAKTLTDAEVRLIKGMLSIRPRMSNQAILAHFTRPGRDINHRVIGQIAAGSSWLSLVPASPAETLAFVAASERRHFPRAEYYLENTGSSSPQASRDVLPLVLDWWPAGQGLFSSGAIIRRVGAPLSWVFDCGTTSSGSLLDSSIERHTMRQECIGADQIKIAALSHFDKDHISGFAKLMRSSYIDIALLPYVPLWQRLMISIEQGVGAESPFFPFYVDPAGFLLGLEEGKIQRVVFVQSTGGEDPVPGPPEGPSEGPVDTGAEDLKLDKGKPPEDAQDDLGASSGRDPRVNFLRKAGRIVAPYFWEFVPYNDAEMLPSVTPAFLSAVEPIINDFRSDHKNRAAHLAKLKNAYDANFGSSSKARNLISLFLYSGPLQHSAHLAMFWASRPTGLKAGTNNLCQLYTGDGYLDTPARLDAFMKFFSAGDRLPRSAFFQVMHHGARSNWQPDIAKRFKPAVSLFSSDPSHKKFGHPHAEVLRDFWPYFGVQVDRLNGFHFSGDVVYK